MLGGVGGVRRELIPDESRRMPMPFVHTEDALADLQQGKMIVLCDDETRENEGDLCLAAEKVTPAAITFMARYGCGLICLALLPDHLERLALPLMVEHNTSRHTTAFTVSIDAREGISTGISAPDRARTILTALDPRCQPDD